MGTSQLSIVVERVHSALESVEAGEERGMYVSGGGGGRAPGRGPERFLTPYRLQTRTLLAACDDHPFRQTTHSHTCSGGACYSTPLPLLYSYILYYAVGGDLLVNRWFYSLNRSNSNLIL